MPVGRAMPIGERGPEIHISVPLFFCPVFFLHLRVPNQIHMPDEPAGV